VTRIHFGCCIGCDQPIRPDAAPPRKGRTMTAPADTVASLPVVRKLREQVPTGAFYSDGYAMIGKDKDGNTVSESRPATPMMRPANRDGAEAAELITGLVEALHALKAEFEKFSRYGSPIAHAANEAIQKADAVLAKAREGAAQ
jgi:hypothetical protein